MNVQPTIVSAATIIDAWRSCAELLVNEGTRLNLLVHISKPSAVSVHDLAPFDPQNVDAAATSLFDVANTIFPSEGPKWNLNAGAFSAYYIPVYERLGRSVPYSWGFYFQRLVEFGPDKVNQLTRIVDGLNSWGRNHHAAFVAHLSSSNIDKPRPQGAPCLQYLQFMRAEDDQLTMTAVYRSHDYFLKALGNFLGLSRILAYICKQTGLSLGPLSCLSTYAFLGNNRGKTKQLLTGK